MESFKCDLYSEMKSLIAENIPFFESEDKDEYLYILKDDDVAKLAHIITNKIQYLLKNHKEKP